ncbi:MAG: beta-lactamase family protein [Gammaproteobacteria bacterium]|nr:beta-lactamase family protein [Gammaproteobacteria bacterium]
MKVNGTCDERFARVRDEFEKNFSDRGDVGASFAATIEGEYVIDLWGGHRDAERTQPWGADTIANVYSTSKTMTFISTLILADRGELDYTAPVANYWPEFAANGKENIPVSNLLSHSAGLPGFSRVFEAEELYDWDTVVADLATQAPWWEPGTQSGYHATTQGFLIGEVIRRITGKTMGTWFRENVAEPLGADFHIGVATQDLPRVADLLPDPAAGDTPMFEMDKDSMMGRVFGSTNLTNDAVNSEAWRRAELPAINGHGNGRSVVRAQTALANDGSAFGVQLLSPAGCARAREVQLESTDLVLLFPIKFAMGYAYGNEMLPVTPNKNAIWWAGAGGSTVVIDEDHRLCFSYVMNQMKAAMVGDERSASLSRALYEAL